MREIRFRARDTESKCFTHAHREHLRLCAKASYDAEFLILDSAGMAKCPETLLADI
jgi:hypothetical protein